MNAKLSLQGQLTKLVSCALLLLCCSAVQAHNVLGGVYAIGAEVEGEVGFSNGDMAPLGSSVVVRNAKGELLLNTLTDDEGFFTFVAPARIDLHIRVDLGAGHVYETVLAADELPESLAGSETSPLPANSGQIEQAAKATASDMQAPNAQELSALVEKAVAKQVKPLRQELNAYKEQASFRDALGGLGYIFGLCGLAMYLRQRKHQS